MTPAANQQTYQNPAWGRPRGDQSWPNQPPFWHPAAMGRPIAIAALVFLVVAGHLGRILFWPLGVAALVYMVASGRFGCRRRWGGNWGQAQNQNQNQGTPSGGPGQFGNGWQPSSASWGRSWRDWCGGGGDHNPTPPSSGNHAFDEYRTETLRRLEEEQQEFSSFLERLRFAKDKSEFDQFMAERRQTPRPPAVPDEPSHG